jgi:hypothetical protein
MTKKQQFWIGNSIKAGNLFSQYTPRELQGLYHPSEMITIIREVEIRKIERLIESVWLARTARKKVKGRGWRLKYKSFYDFIKTVRL